MHPLTEKFAALFDGRPQLYGVYDLSKVVISESSGKNVGQATTREKPLTREVWSRHLNGEEGIGVVPIRDDGTCVFGAIDIDSYKGFDPGQIARQASDAGLPLVICRSKSGGAHCYMFALAPVQAALMQARLKECAARLNLSPKVEIFPKQIKLDLERGDHGSWINAPYLNASKTDRYAYNIDGELTPEQFLIAAEGAKQPPEFFEHPIPRPPSEFFADGPPCLERLAASGRICEGSRNESLFHIGVYAKLKSEAEGSVLQTDLDNWNHQMFNPPLGSDEVTNIRKSLNRKGYKFKCKSEPFASMCDGAVCQMRPYGVGRSGDRGEATDAAPATFPTITALEWVNTEPATWYLTVNGREVALTTREYYNARLAVERIADTLGIFMPLVTDKTWERMRADLDRHKTVVEIEKGEGGSQRAEFWSFVETFCRRPPANDRSEVRSSRPWTEDGYTWFVMHQLTTFLGRNGFKVEQSIIYRWLKDAKAKKDTWRVLGDVIRVWGVPAYEKLENPPELTDETPF